MIEEQLIVKPKRHIFRKLLSLCLTFVMLLTVVAIPVQAAPITLSITGPTTSSGFLPAGKSYQIETNRKPQNSGCRFEWKIASSAMTKGVVAISASGRLSLSSDAMGTVTIQVTEKGNTGTSTVLSGKKVFKVQPVVKSISLDKANITLDKYKPSTCTVKVTTDPSFGDVRTGCTITSSDTAIAPITTTATGFTVKTGSKKGTATVTVRAKEGTAAKSFKVTVIDSTPPPTTKPPTTKPPVTTKPAPKPPTTTKPQTTKPKKETTTKPKKETSTKKNTVTKPTETTTELPVETTTESPVEEIIEETPEIPEAFVIVCPQIKITKAEDKILFDWDAIDNVNGYALYVWIDGAEPVVVYSGSETYYELSHFSPDMKINVKIRAFKDVEGNIIFSNFGDTQEYTTEKESFVADILKLFGIKTKNNKKNG